MISPGGKSPQIRTGLVAKRPIHVLAKPIKADYGSLIKGIGKAVTNAATTQWEKLGNDFIEISLALGVNKEPEELAFLLVYRSFGKALIELTAESANLLAGRPVLDSVVLENTIADQMEKTKVVIDEKFIRSPNQSDFVKTAILLVEIWLKSRGVSAVAANAISHRFPAYFVYAVNQELGRNRANYDPLLTIIITPTSRAAEREMAWEIYVALLERQTQESVFDEPFGLRQLYIPLRAAASPDPNDSKNKKESIVDLESELLQWLENKDPKDAIRVISGEPGSGKSVFMRLFAAKVAIQNRRVLLIPLHMIDPERDLTEEIGRFAQQEGSLGYDPMINEERSQEIILIFDGLDELDSQGRTGINIARTFIHSVERMLNNRNMQKLCVRVLLSGRQILIDEDHLMFRRPKQVLNLLPYFISDNEKKQYSDQNGLLHHDARSDWWRNYGKLTGRNYKGLPVEFSVGSLYEMTKQPLLNYLVAIAFAPGGLVYTPQLNLNVIYQNLIERVYERGYEKGRIFEKIRHLSLGDFCRILEEIGLSAWHGGDGRTTTVDEIREHCQKSSIDGFLEVFQEGAEKGVTRLLAAFFFRRYGQRDTGDQTFVFTHKSFGEYLAARRIVFEMKILARNILRHDDDPTDGYDERVALEHWCKICGPASFSHHLTSFLCQEVALQAEEVVLSWQTVFTRLFNSMLKAGMPIEKLLLPTFQKSLHHNRNAEQGLLIALNACSRKTRVISKLKHPSTTAFGTWLHRSQQQRDSNTPNLVSRCLSHLDLSNCHLDAQDLFGAHLDGSILSGCTVYYSTFDQKEIVETVLHGAEFSMSEINGLFPKES